MSNNNEHIEPPRNKFNSHFDLTMQECEKKQFTPWLLEKCLGHELGQNPKAIRSKNKITLTIVITTESQSNKIVKLKSLNNINIEVNINNNCKINKGLIYIYGFDLSDYENFRQSLIRETGLVEVENAHWIKPRNPNAKAMLINFRENTPNFISIPGEQAKTQVFPCKDKPKICKKCQQFYHGEKYCAGDLVCARCSAVGHKADSCNIALMNCPHCSGVHKADHEDCPELKLQMEVLAWQYNQMKDSLASKRELFFLEIMLVLK